MKQGYNKDLTLNATFLINFVFNAFCLRRKHMGRIQTYIADCIKCVLSMAP
jgi:hypothetical protein